MDIESLVSQDFNGAISVVRAGKTLLERGYGFADIPNRVPNRIDTRFATASAGKVFVAVGILHLVEIGRLSLEAGIGSILKFDLKGIDPDVTVRQLLTHTSGIADYFDESTMKEYAELWVDVPNYRIRRSSDLLPLFIDKPMVHPAGARFQYNNAGFVLLGLVIEEVTGEPFDRFLESAVFEPCGMHDTGYFELDRLPANCANSYILDVARGEYYTNIYSVDAKGTGAGGAFTTIPDVRRFWESLLGCRLLSREMVSEMLSPQAHEGDEHYGFGIWLEKTADGAFAPFFQGSDPGVSFISCHDASRDLQLTIVSNRGDNVWRMRREIVAGL